MENNKIILPKFTKKESGYRLNDCVYEYKKILANENSEVDAMIARLDEIAREKNMEFYEYIRERLEQWEKLIGKYLKITIWSNGRSYEKFYLFPYRLIKTNNCLFCLRSSINDDYNGGITSENFNVIDGGILTSELEIEEVTKEEMLANAIQRINDVLDVRLDKMNTSEKEYTITWENRLKKS